MSKEEYNYPSGYEKVEKCMLCGKSLKPDLEALNYITKIWDGYTYFLCKCAGKVDKNMRISIG